MFIFKRTLGVLYETDYYVAKKPATSNVSGHSFDPNSTSGTAPVGGYLKPFVFFDRFCFDMVSLLGEHLNLLSFSDVEYIMRKVYQHSTHYILINPVPMVREEAGGRGSSIAGDKKRYSKL
jgi:hypothetical protein